MAKYQISTTLSDTGIVIKGNCADGASAIAVIVDNAITLTNAAAKILKICNNGASLVTINYQGAVDAYSFHSTGTISADLGLYTGNGAVNANGGNIGLTLTASESDDASAVALTVNNSTTLTNTAAKLNVWQNNGVEKSYIDKDGGYYTSTGKVVAPNIPQYIKVPFDYTSFESYGEFMSCVYDSGGGSYVAEVYRWNGASWAATGLAAPSTGSGGAGQLAGSSSSDIMVTVGTSGNPHIYYYNGASWTDTDPAGLSWAYVADYNRGRTIGKATGSSFWAISSSGTNVEKVKKWTGSAWVDAGDAVIGVSGYSIHVISDSDVWVGGRISGGTGHIYHWDGANWTDHSFSIGSGSSVFHIYKLDSTHVYFLTGFSYGGVYYWNGSTVVDISPTGYSGWQWGNIKAFSSTQVALTGWAYYGEGNRLLIFDGANWTSSTYTTWAGAYWSTIYSSTSALLIDNTGQTYKYDGSWTMRASPVTTSGNMDVIMLGVTATNISSTASMPAGSLVTRASVVVTTPFTGTATCHVKSGSTVLMEHTDNNLLVANQYDTYKYTDVAGGGVITVEPSGSAGAGVGYSVVEFVVPRT